MSFRHAMLSDRMLLVLDFLVEISLEREKGLYTPMPARERFACG